jgi:hypothetical protein
MQYSPLPCYLVPPRPKCPPQHSILEHPQPMFAPQYERPSFTQYKTTGKITVPDILFIFFYIKLADKRFCNIVSNIISYIIIFIWELIRNVMYWYGLFLVLPISSNPWRKNA